MKAHKTWHQLHVEPVDQFTYRVESESGNAPYFVDALANSGKGRCDCRDFQCRVAPIYDGAKQVPLNEPMFVAACKLFT